MRRGSHEDLPARKVSEAPPQEELEKEEDNSGKPQTRRQRSRRTAPPTISKEDTDAPSVSLRSQGQLSSTAEINASSLARRSLQSGDPVEVQQLRQRLQPQAPVPTLPLTQLMRCDASVASNSPRSTAGGDSHPVGSFGAVGSFGHARGLPSPGPSVGLTSLQHASMGFQEPKRSAWERKNLEGEMMQSRLEAQQAREEASRLQQEVLRLQQENQRMAQQLEAAKAGQAMLRGLNSTLVNSLPNSSVCSNDSVSSQAPRGGCRRVFFCFGGGRSRTSTSSIGSPGR